MTKEQVFDVLVEEIMSGALGPGKPLVERALAERFGLSRTPIREVVQRLQREYLVDSYRNQGAFVRKLGPRDVRDLFQLREALEPLAASLAAQNRPDAEVAALRERFPSSEVARGLKPRELSDIGEAMHDGIAAWSGNTLLQDIYATLHKQTRLVRSMTRSRIDVEIASLSEHLAILDAIERGDGPAAHERMLGHLRRSHAAVMDLIVSRE